MHRSIARCTTCRVSLLDAFTSLAGVSLPASTRKPGILQQIPRQYRVKSPRYFSQFARLRQSDSPAPEADSVETPATSTFIPWYLQVEDPAPPVSHTTPQDLLRQEIPPLPANPPSILYPVLNHLSTQIGLDNLVLLDLRDINPPPALGSNLLMIIGTARSVKHLNVSADRFCRWARREFKLRPYADGLLGRNELKLKLRRKARRLRLARSVGNTLVDDNADDGITTGWICVNMGAIDVDIDVTNLAESQQLEKDDFQEGDEPEDEEEYSNPPEPELPTNNADPYIGFGSKINLPRIVVQMFTEDKRNEMDLEGLWDVRNTRLGQKADKADAEFEVGFESARDDADVDRESKTNSLEVDAAQEVRKQEVEKSWEESTSQIAEEVENSKKREGEDESKPLAGMGAT